MRRGGLVSGAIGGASAARCFCCGWGFQLSSNFKLRSHGFTLGGSFHRLDGAPLWRVSRSYYTTSLWRIHQEQFRRCSEAIRPLKARGKFRTWPGLSGLRHDRAGKIWIAIGRHCALFRKFMRMSLVSGLWNFLKRGKFRMRMTVRMNRSNRRFYFSDRGCSF